MKTMRNALRRDLTNFGSLDPYRCFYVADGSFSRWQIVGIFRNSSKAQRWVLEYVQFDDVRHHYSTARITTLADDFRTRADAERQMVRYWNGQLCLACSLKGDLCAEHEDPRTAEQAEHDAMVAREATGIFA